MQTMTARPALGPIHAGLNVLRRVEPAAQAVALLALRIALAVPFFRSGLTKWDGFLSLSDSADALFSDEFKLHILGAEYAYPFPHLMAFASGCAEIALPVLLVFGLASRFAGLGLLIMTAIIQLTIPDGWANFHLIWASCALAILAFGPGPISLDALIKCLFSARR